MPLCGFNPKMIKGIAMFAEGLFEATVSRAHDESMTLPEAFKIELRDIGLFLQALEDKHQELKRQMHPKEATAGVADLAFKWRNEER